MPASTRKRLSLGIGVIALAILASLLAFVLIGQREAAASARLPYVDRHVENGDWAGMWGSLPEAVTGDPQTACWVNINVSRGGSARAPQTNLNYDLSQWDPNAVWEDKEGTIHTGMCVSAQSGYGVIPNGSYRVTSQSEALNVDTSAVPGFELWSGAGGVISLTWQKTSTYESRHSGTDSWHDPRYSWSRVGTWSESSATAAGTILGHAVSSDTGGSDKGGGASVGSSSGVSVCMSSDPNGCFGGK